MSLSELFSPQEREAYEDNLKYYRDLKNVVDTSRMEGRMEGRTEGIIAEKVEIARNMKAEGEPTEKIARYTGLSKDEIEKL